MTNAGLFMLAAIAVGFAVWFITSSRSFAERNPELALLEGAELIEWRRMEVEAKGVPAPAEPTLIEDKGGQPRSLPSGNEA